MGHDSEAFIGIDTSKSGNAVAIAEGGRGGEVRYLGEFPATEAGTHKLVGKSVAKYNKLTFCYETGPTGSGSTAESRASTTSAWWWLPHLRRRNPASG